MPPWLLLRILLLSLVATSSWSYYGGMGDGRWVARGWPAASMVMVHVHGVECGGGRERQRDAAAIFGGRLRSSSVFRPSVPLGGKVRESTNTQDRRYLAAIPTHISNRNSPK